MPNSVRSIAPWLFFLLQTLGNPLLAAEGPPFRVGLEARGAAVSDPARTTGWGREVHGALQVSQRVDMEAGLQELKLSNDLSYLSVSAGFCWSTRDGKFAMSARGGSGRYSWNGMNGSRTWELALSPRLRLSRTEQAWSWGASTSFTLNKPGEKTLMIFSPGVWFKLGF